MKPILLEIQAFGPYTGRQTVDFAKLSQAGIFLIKGPTGSGKTTIFDAMMFALYGGSSGSSEKDKGGRNDLEEWRCSQAEDKLPTEVSFTFSLSGRTYQFTRRLVPKRKNLSGEYSAGELDEDGNLLPFFENPKKDDLTRKAEELIGLTREQFRQVILLPQGQFEKFLTADANEKEKILKLIFDTARWETYSENFYSAADSRKKALAEEKKDIDRALAEEGVQSLEELERKIAQLEKAINENQAAQKEYAAEQKQEALNRDIRLAERFKPLHDLEKHNNQLADRQEEFAKKGEAYQQAEKAETLRTLIGQAEAAYADQNNWKTNLDSAQRQLPGAQKQLEDAQSKKADHDANDPTADLQAKVGSYEEKRSVYQAITKLRGDFQTADFECRKAEQNAKGTAAKLTTALGTFEAAYKQMDAKEAAAVELRRRYFAGICGELAQQLEENAPCPVCGSLHHPNPARKAPDSVSKAELEQAEQAAETARDNWKQADTSRAEAEKKKNAAVQAMAEAQNNRTAAKKDLDNAEASLIPGIRDLTALDRAVKQLKYKITAYQTEGKALQTAIDEFNRKLSKVEADVKSFGDAFRTASDKFAECKAALDAALTEKGYTTVQEVRQQLLPYDQRQKMYTELISYEKDVADTREKLEAAQQKLAGLEEPDQNQFAARQKAIREAQERFSRLDSETRQQKKRLSEKQGRLQEKNTHYLENIQQAEDDFTFAKKLRGDSGVGLHRYILSVMFSQMLGEANRMLSKVHGGRYQLRQTFDKASGNKRGLNLKVYDNRSPEKEGRNVAMLSGGEKFLVSLALSIGISTVAQSSGIRIETLFIDEGFGTLDDSSINDAMDVLESVRRSSGMIGIISHVPLLESNIPVHLEVVKTNSGSTILPV